MTQQMRAGDQTLTFFPLWAAAGSGRRSSSLGWKMMVMIMTGMVSRKIQ